MDLKPTIKQMFNVAQIKTAAPPKDREQGWKTDPLNSKQYRWWDGKAWTEHAGGGAGETEATTAGPTGTGASPTQPTGAEFSENRPDIEAAAQRLKMTMGAKRELSRLHEILGDEEKVLELARGTYGSRVGLIVLTDQRILFYNEGWTGSVNQDLPLRECRSVAVGSGIVYSSVLIQARGNSVAISKVVKDDAARIVKAAREQLHRVRQPQSAVQTQGLIDAAAAKSPMEQLKQLAELRDAGVVTEEEFEAKKAELLGRI